MKSRVSARKIAVLTAGIAAAAIAVPLSVGSSHREAPNIALDPTADNTDVYAFTAADAPDALTIVSNWIPGQVPANGPNFFRFDDRARYYVNIDNKGDGKPNARYQFRFKIRSSLDRDVARNIVAKIVIAKDRFSPIAHLGLLASPSRFVTVDIEKK